MTPLSVSKAFEGRRLLVTGTSGFLGKVWLASLLLELPGPVEITILLRPGRKGARRRFEDLVASCPSFAPLHERFGPDLAQHVAERVRVVAGDLSKPLLGLDEPTLARLGRLDLVVNLAGLTDLEPDLRDALATNVDGALQALEVARRTGAKLLHVSTAYVAGARKGQIPEACDPNYAPNPGAFEAARELLDLRALIADHERRAQAQHQTVALRARAREQLVRHGATYTPEREAEFLERERERWLAEQLDVAARERAHSWGWPNVYTFTKSLAESLLVQQRAEVPVWIVRPTIVESALAFPCPGWKEGLHTSAPLVYALTRGPLRGLPARERLVLDVIPVDFVARGLSVVGASALCEAQADAVRVFHLGSSDRNPLPMRRVVELSTLAHRAERKADPKPRRLRDLLAADAVATTQRIYQASSLPLLRRLTQGAEELLEAAAEVLPSSLSDRSRRAARSLDRQARKLESLEDVVERFRPFVLENDCRFEAAGIRELERRLDPSEAQFVADPATLDWRDYWLNVHVPGLRRWIYPRIEGRRGPRPPRRPFSLLPERDPVEAS